MAQRSVKRPAVRVRWEFSDTPRHRAGDRASDCGGIMEPIAVWVRKGGEWAIIHRCRRCGALSANRVAADDNPMKLMSIAMKPLCEPPFPLERIREMTDLMGGDGTLQMIFGGESRRFPKRRKNT